MLDSFWIKTFENCCKNEKYSLKTKIILSKAFKKNYGADKISNGAKEQAIFFDFFVKSL